ncbi:hypothetical protein G7B40_010570 [Aetokthonos hydrillicola Thurmond2011]|jgi:hypothetical protein|uniref:Uncharacterized protein n=1 Tax=Aetokthonos hydrillicola Thurmond2011 TaxID=2712845 RepID=A0AAP5M9S6_9CYAN|nr:hypothetical protein [Aetokthonos hydrillicola]MBO3462773.1 hypothetical protein [Aetokthonos hydrillicola CCALA 1050]MBW4590652.1 hypothetical protein [Aetokthonos hydrillicola CCALA 1050]MDR9895008.1 hypothetical protein [Aetokthonos hydrillicola Thurmond2011]
MKKLFAFMTTLIIACFAIVGVTVVIVSWDSWGQMKTSMAIAQTTVACPANSNEKCLDIDVYEALNIMPREDRPLLGPSLGAYYSGSSSPPNPLVIKPGDSVTFFIGPQYFLPASYLDGGSKYVPHVGAGPMWPLHQNDPPIFPEAIFTNNKVTFNSGDPSNPQQVIKEFGHAGVKDDPPSPTSAQYLIASGPITYNKVGEFVAAARVQMIRHFYVGCSPNDWQFVPTKEDLCSSGQTRGVHSPSSQDRLIDITVSRLIKVVR